MRPNKRPGYLTSYAKHAGISKQAAAKQLARVGVDYLQLFDFAEADRKREAARHADRSHVAVPIYLDDPDEADAEESKDDSKDPIFSKSQARKELFRSKLAELEFLQRVGDLVDKQKVEAEQFRLGRLVRDALLNIPERLAGVLTEETDQRKTHDLIEKEIRQVLEALTSLDVANEPAAHHKIKSAHG